MLEAMTEPLNSVSQVQRYGNVWNLLLWVNNDALKEEDRLTEERQKEAKEALDEVDNMRRRIDLIKKPTNEINLAEFKGVYHNLEHVLNNAEQSFGFFETDDRVYWRNAKHDEKDRRRALSAVQDKMATQTNQSPKESYEDYGLPALKEHVQTVLEETALSFGYTYNAERALKSLRRTDDAFRSDDFHKSIAYLRWLSARE